MAGREVTAPKIAFPLMVQAYRAGQHVTWFTDSRHDDLPGAIAAAEALHAQFQRKIQIIDQEERVYLRLPRPKPRAMVTKAKPCDCCGHIKSHHSSRDGKCLVNTICPPGTPDAFPDPATADIDTTGWLVNCKCARYIPHDPAAPPKVWWKQRKPRPKP